MSTWFKKLLNVVLPAQAPKEVPAHQHEWKLQYRTGNAFDGKSEVCKCDCGQWAVRHYGQREYILLDN